MKLKLRPNHDKTIPFLIFISFLVTFVLSRTITYLFPNLFFITRGGTHVHHLSYGIILLSLVGLISLSTNLSHKNKLRLSVVYGIALGLAFDEFAMWLELDNIYHDRRNYDAIMTISLIFLNIIYFDNFWRRWGYRLGKLLRIIIGTPKTVYHALKNLLPNN